MQMITAHWLKSVEALKAVPLKQLAWFISNSSVRSLEPDELLFKPNMPIEATYIVYSGQISMYVLQNNESREFALASPGSINGYLPFSRGKINFGYGRALEKTHLLSFPVEKINEMICTHLELTEALVHVMTSRVKAFATRQQQDEKMMALGKLSAGLAHELNNPAGALLRNARSLAIHLKAARNGCFDFLNLNVEQAVAYRLQSFLEKSLNKSDFLKSSVMDHTLLEDELGRWLDMRDISPNGSVVEIMADYKISVEDLLALTENQPLEIIEHILGWTSSHLLIKRMLADIIAASQSIVELVGSVKIFTHMDQSRDKQYTDIHEGIRNTLVMLRHKVHQYRITIIEEFDPSLPPVNAIVGELNQVWMNLIDNSLDAMEEAGSGILKIRTCRREVDVEICFTDNGPGIAPALQEKIFEPFFSTKGAKNGSGLGLDIVQCVILEHGGCIRLETVPHNTVFKVYLPING
jgi:signal transduction histidine kinase